MSALESLSSPLVSPLVGRSGSGSIRSPSEGRTLLTLSELSPDMSFHWDNFGRLMLDGLTVSKKLSNWMWNCGDNTCVYRLSIKSADDEDLGDCPRFIPSLALDYHLGCCPPT